MQIEIKELDECKLLVHYEAGPEEILNKRAEVLKSFKKAPAPGFRPGKASMDAIKIHYKSQIEDSLKRALAEDAFHNTLFEKKLRPHGAPRFNSLLMGDGKFTCEFEMFTKPEFELASYKDLEIPKPHLPTSAIEMSEKMMQDLRVRFGESIPYEPTDFVQMGDSVIIDYDGTIDGEKVETLCAQGEMLTIGAGQLFHFDDNLLGMKIDESREFDLLIPETGLPSVAGKNVHFTVKLTMGSKNIPAPLNDDLAIKIGKKDFAELKEFVNGMALANVANAQAKAINESIAHRLINDNEFPVPQWLAVSEAQYLVNNSKLNWETLPDQDKEKFIELGRKNVKLSLILDRVREVEPEAQISDQEVFNIVKQNLAKTQVKTPLDEVMKEMNRTGYLQILFARIKDEFALSFIVKNAKMIE